MNGTIVSSTSKILGCKINPPVSGYFPQLDHSSTLIWAGAGISYPTLPLSSRLTEFVLRETCTDKVALTILSKWEIANKIARSHDYDLPFGNTPRLETILGVIEELERTCDNHDFSFIQGFGSVADAPPNDSHRALASLLRRGATIITTNFDLCIERAYRSESPGGIPLRGRWIDTAHVFESSGSSGVGRVIHLHGTASDTRRMAATIARIKPGLSPKVERLLDSTFAKHTSVHIVGYSASDWFDINPYLSSRGRDKFASTNVLFFQHDDAEPPPELQTLFRAFRSLDVRRGSTLAHLSELTGLKLTIDATRFAWEESFIGRVNLKQIEQLRPYLVCAIGVALGMDSDQLLRAPNKTHPWAFGREFVLLQ
jgi:hypothetical protein